MAGSMMDIVIRWKDSYPQKFLTSIIFSNFQTLQRLSPGGFVRVA